MRNNSLDQAKSELLRASGAGISLPIAGIVYWVFLGAAGNFLSPKMWGLAACFSSRLIFPLGLLLSKTFGSNLLIKNQPLSSLGLRAVISINLLWPLHFAIYFNNPQLLPLSLAIGMGIHWPIIGWMYGSSACFQHALVRVAAVSIVWFLYPAGRFTLLPLVVAVVYLVTVFQLRRQLKAANNSLESDAAKPRTSS